MRYFLPVLLLALSLTGFSQPNSTKGCWVGIKTKEGIVYCKVPCKDIPKIAKLKGGDK